MTQEKRTIGKYSIDKELGSGEAATVYKATIVEGKDKGETVAFKEYKDLKGEDLKRKKQRFQATKELRNDHILQPISGDFRSKSKHIVMELAEGSLKDILKRYYGQQFPEEEIALVLTHIASGLTYLHSSGINIAHLDIKPSNILYYTKGENTVYIIADFDSSVDLKGTATKDQKSKALEFTPEYAGPEQFEEGYRGKKESDIFALGMTLYELMTNKVIDRQKGQMPLGEVFIPGNYSSRLRAIVIACLSEESSKRPDALEIASEGKFYLNQGRWSDMVSPKFSPYNEPSLDSITNSTRIKRSFFWPLFLLGLIGGGYLIAQRFIFKKDISQLITSAKEYQTIGGYSNLRIAREKYEEAIEASSKPLSAVEHELQSIKTILESNFYKIRPFKSNMAAVKKSQNGKWGFLDNTGSLIVECKYDKVSDFYGEYAIVYTSEKEKQKCGFIDKTGKEIIQLQLGTFATIDENTQTGTITTKNNKEIKFNLKTGKQL